MNEVPSPSRGGWIVDATGRRLSVAAPLCLSRCGSLSVLSLGNPRSPILARISGDTSPYSWQEQVPMPGGSWRDGPGAGVANAHEVNGRAGLDGKVVLLRPTVVGDYRFLWVRQTFAEPGGRYSCRPCDIPLADLQIDLIYLDDRGRLRLRSTRLHFVSPGLWESGPVNILDYWLEGYVEHHFRLFCEEGRAVLRHGVGPVGDDGHHPVEADFREVLFFSCVPFRYDFVFNPLMERDTSIVVGEVS